MAKTWYIALSFDLPDLPGSLQAAVRCLLDDTDYVSVVRASMVGGG